MNDIPPNMTKPKTLKAHCNNCSGDRNHIILSKTEKPGSETVDQFSVESNDTYYLLECQGCETVKMLHESWCSEDVAPDGTLNIARTYYPPALFRKEPHWMSNLDKAWHLTKLITEIYRVLQNDAPSLAAMGIRAAIEAIAIDKVGDHGSFGANLRYLQEGGFISPVQSQAINATLELGHASIHRGYVPEASQLHTALDILEHLIHGIYVLGPEAASQSKTIPKRSA